MEWFYLALLNPAIFALINILDDNRLFFININKKMS